MILDTVHISLCVVLLCLLILTLVLFFKKKDVVINDNDLVLKNSLVPNGGRGVFSKKDYNPGDIVEVAPFVVCENNLHRNKINDYVFQYSQDPNKVITVFGMGSMYNHKDDHNLDYIQDIQNNNMIYKARKRIRAGDELYVNYGPGYWNSRKYKKH